MNLAANVDLGNLPEWFAIFVTLVAAIFAACAARAAYGQLRVLQQDADKRNDTERRAQASPVKVWLELDDNNQVVAWFVNASNLPIFHVTINFIAPQNHRPITYLNLPATNRPLALPEVTELATSIAAKDDRVSSLMIFKRNPSPSPKTSEVNESDGTGSVGVTVTFDDIENRRWHRGLDGRLAEVSDDFERFRGGVIP